MSVNTDCLRKYLIALDQQFRLFRDHVVKNGINEMEKTTLIFFNYHTGLVKIGVKFLLESQFRFSQNLYWFNAF